MKEEMKAIQSEIKEMYREPTVKGRKPDSNQRFGTKGINKHPTGTEWRNKNSKKKNEERRRNLWDNFKRSNIQIIGVPEGEEEEQQIENFFEQIRKKFPNMVKETDFQ